MSKNVEPTKYQQEETLDPQNTWEKKFQIYHIPRRKNFGPKKHPRKKILKPQNTHKKYFGSTKYPLETNFGPTKYPQEKISDPRKNNGLMTQDPQDPRWHNTHGI